MVDLTRPFRFKDGILSLNPNPKYKAIGRTGFANTALEVEFARKVYVVDIRGHSVDIPETELDKIFENHEPNRPCDKCLETIYGKAL